MSSWNLLCALRHSHPEIEKVLPETFRKIASMVLSILSWYSETLRLTLSGGKCPSTKSEKQVCPHTFVHILCVSAFCVRPVLPVGGELG